MGDKERCRLLKEIRKVLADKLDIDLQQKECTYEGECGGTCPKCEQEEKVLNTMLLKKGMVVAGTAALTISLAACTPVGFHNIEGDTEPLVVEEPDSDPEPLAGDVEIQEDYESPEDMQD